MRKIPATFKNIKEKLLKYSVSSRIDVYQKASEKIDKLIVLRKTKSEKDALRYLNDLVKNEIDVGIYNYPLCCVDQPYWSLCEKSITDYKVRYLPQCNQCIKKDACGGMFSGTYNLMKGVIEPIL